MKIYLSVNLARDYVLFDSACDLMNQRSCFKLKREKDCVYPDLFHPNNRVFTRVHILSPSLVCVSCETHAHNSCTFNNESASTVSRMDKSSCLSSPFWVNLLQIHYSIAHHTHSYHPDLAHSSYPIFCLHYLSHWKSHV